MSTKTPFDFGPVLSSLRAAVERADTAAARTHILRLQGKRPPREMLLSLANLSRRAGQPGHALSWLNPIVRPRARTPVEATLAEQAEYAACLISVGAVEEGLDLLHGIDADHVPQALLYEALALFTRWDYALAIPVLRRYLDSSGLSPYQTAVGRLNLLAALIVERKIDEAATLFETLREDLQRAREVKLYGNLLELRAQWALVSSHWKEGEAALAEARRILGETGLIDEILVDKWTAILDLSRNGASPERLARLQSIRDRARKFGHWETLRDCDRVEARITQNEALLRRVLAGTPFSAFRASALREFGVTISDRFSYTLQLGTGEPRLTIDLLSGREEGSRRIVRPGGQCHRLLASLTLDFYRPLRLAALHFMLFPKEYYNPVSAPARVHSALLRFRRWASAARLPLEIRCERGLYSLHARKPIRLRLARDERGGVLPATPLAPLDVKFPNSPFTRRQAKEALRYPDRTLQRLLKRAVAEGQLRTQGQGKATKYRVVRKP